MDSKQTNLPVFDFQNE